jgi:tripartite-type tricarboxylate transporter receptor subunit TctC
MFRTLLAGSIALAVSALSPAWAQDYPVQPVRIVVSVAPGGTNDIVARLIGQALSERMKQSFVIENRTGADGTIAAAAVARATPDGYTLLLGNTSLLAIQPSLFTKLPYDTKRDFAPVSIIAESPSVLVANAALPVHTLQEFITYAKARPGKLAYGSPGSGSPFHLAGELFKTQAGIDMIHVPYRGAAPALTDLLGGQVQAMFDNVPHVMEYIRSGKLRALAVTTSERLPELPDVPTMAQAGFPGAESRSFFALVAPAGTPAPVLSALASALSQSLADAEMKSKLAELGANPIGGTPAQAKRYLEQESTRWAKAVDASGARATIETTR